MLKYIFPRTNELCVFVITVVLYATILATPELMALIKDLTVEFWLNASSVLAKSEGHLQALIAYLALISLSVSVVVFFLGPLLLPFTEKDIRAVSLCILWVDVLLLISWSNRASGEASFHQLFLSFYGSVWLVYSFFIVKLNPKGGIGYLVDSEQTSPKVALLASGLGIVLVLFFIVGLGWWWLDAYVTAVFMALFSERLVNSLRIRLNSQNENQGAS